MTDVEKSDYPLRSFCREQNGPLADVRVLDLSRLVAGNSLTCMLADFGADVVKIEDPNGGDALREWLVDEIPFYWKVYGRNKRSVTLDLRTPDAKETLRRLVRSAQCLVESFRHGTLEKWGLGPDVLLRLNPKLVVVRVSAWGQTGPYRTRPGYGTLVEAMSGFADKTGFEDKPPLLPSLPLADQVAGLSGAFATVVALRHAEATGQGQVVDLSLLEPLHAILGPDAAIKDKLGRSPRRTGNQSPTAAPRNIYSSSDGHFIAISAAMQSMAERLLKLIGGPGLAEDPRFRTGADRLRNIAQLDAIIDAFTSTKTLQENLSDFDVAGVTAGPVYDPELFIADRHVRDREVLVRMADTEIGDILMHNVSPRLSVSPGSLRRPAPALGAHNKEILAELDLTYAGEEPDQRVDDPAEGMSGR